MEAVVVGGGGDGRSKRGRVKEEDDGRGGFPSRRPASPLVVGPPCGGRRAPSRLVEERAVEGARRRAEEE